MPACLPQKCLPAFGVRSRPFPRGRGVPKKSLCLDLAARRAADGDDPQMAQKVTEMAKNHPIFSSYPFFCLFFEAIFAKSAKF